MNRPMRVTHEDRCVGCLLGKAIGDILGAGVEGWPAALIQARFEQVRDFLDTDRGFGRYTDDTQMAIALAKSLVESGHVDPAHAARSYADAFEPWRGYGATAHSVIRALRQNADYRETGRLHFPAGSFGNGGAMRIAPVGLVYRNASNGQLRRAVQDALLCTHVHPEAVDGAFIQAKAVAFACTASAGSFDPVTFLQELARLSEEDSIRQRLEFLSDALASRLSDEDVIDRVGNGVRTREAVAAALWAFARQWSEPEQCVIRAVGLGGDTDTIGAMAGALAGALHGTSWIPQRWFDNIENGTDGRDQIVDLARQLAALEIVDEG